MVDKELIKYIYSNLPDAKLVTLVKEEGTSITYEAFILLKREYLNRGLSQEIIIEVEKLRQEKSKEKIRNNFITEGQITDDILWNGVLTQKAEGKRDPEIIKWLTQEGVSGDTAIEVIGKLEQLIKKQYNQVRKKILLSFLFVLIGAMLWVFAFLGLMITTSLIIGSMMVLTPIKSFPANNRMYRLCEKALIVIERELSSKM